VRQLTLAVRDQRAELFEFACLALGAGVQLCDAGVTDIDEVTSFCQLPLHAQAPCDGQHDPGVQRLDVRRNTRGHPLKSLLLSRPPHGIAAGFQDLRCSQRVIAAQCVIEALDRMSRIDQPCCRLEIQPAALAARLVFQAANEKFGE